MKKFFLAVAVVALSLSGNAFAKGAHVSSAHVSSAHVSSAHESVSEAPVSHTETSSKTEESGNMSEDTTSTYVRTSPMVDTYVVSHPNVKSNGCPEGEHVDERHQCVTN